MWLYDLLSCVYADAHVTVVNSDGETLWTGMCYKLPYDNCVCKVVGATHGTITIEL